MNALAAEMEELQPCRAAVALGVVREAELRAAAGSGSSRGIRSGGSESDAPLAVAASLVAAEGVSLSSRLLSQLAYLQAGSTAAAGADAEIVEGGLGWVDKLSCEAAAAALFATWYWAQPQQTAGHPPQGAAAAGPLPPVPAGVGLLGLALYHQARQGSTLSASQGRTNKPTLDSLVLDLALMAAAGAGSWEEGKERKEGEGRWLHGDVGCPAVASMAEQTPRGTGRLCVEQQRNRKIGLWNSKGTGR